MSVRELAEGLRLDPDVVAWFKARANKGRHQTCVNQAFAGAGSIAAEAWGAQRASPRPGEG